MVTDIKFAGFRKRWSLVNVATRLRSRFLLVYCQYYLYLKVSNFTPQFYPLELFWTVLIRLYFILRNSQPESAFFRFAVNVIISLIRWLIMRSVLLWSFEPTGYPWACWWHVLREWHTDWCLQETYQVCLPCLLQSQHNRPIARVFHEEVRSQLGADRTRPEAQVSSGWGWGGGGMGARLSKAVLRTLWKTDISQILKLQNLFFLQRPLCHYLLDSRCL